MKRHQNLYHNPNYVPPEPKVDFIVCLKVSIALLGCISLNSIIFKFDLFQKEKTHECPHCSRSFRHKGNLIRHMDLHDPDSTAKEKAVALKAGRQKKIQIIDGIYLIKV